MLPGEGDRRALTTLGLAAILSAEMFLVVPGSLYLGNLSEFATSAGPLARTLMIPALGLLLLVVLAGILAGPARHARFTAVIAGLALLFWLQAYVLVWDYGPLDGRHIDWETDPWRGWVDLGIWIGVLLCAWNFHRRLHRFLITSVIVLFAAQCTLLGSAALRHLEELRARGPRQVTADRLAAMYRFSPDRNVVHLVLDSFQSDIFREIIDAGAEGADIRSWLDGFVFYEENTGAFPYTAFALPAMLSGEVYRNDVPQKMFIKSTFGGRTILNAVSDAGYEIDLASESMMVNMLTQGRYTNSYLIADNLHFSGKAQAQDEAAKLVDLAWFRLAPHFLKPLIYNDQRWRVQNLLGRAEHLRFAYFRNNGFLLNVARSLSADRTAPVYKFFHLMSTHAPMVVHPDCSYAGTLPRIRVTVLTQSRCTLRFVHALVDAMKAAGIYDNALIMIMGDHGGHIPPARYVPEAVTDGQETYVVNPWTVAMATPLLLVKPPGASGPLQISAAPTSLLDVPATVASVLRLDGGFEGRSILDSPPAEVRERRFYYYPWRNEDNALDYILPIQEFIIRGSIYRSDSWRHGRVFPPPPGTDPRW